MKAIAICYTGYAPKADGTVGSIQAYYNQQGTA